MRNPMSYIKPFVAKNEPAILIGMGITGLLFSTVWSIKATFKVSKEIESYKKEKDIDKLLPKEIFKLSWKHYLPVVISTAVSIPCIIAGNSVSNKRYTALAAAYTISEAALQEYQEKARSIIGEKKAKEIQEAVNADKIQQTYHSNNQIIITDKGEHLFYEPLSGRYFKSNWNDIMKAANELNSEAINDIVGNISLNSWFSKLGLEETAMGDEIGWSLVNGTNSLIDIEISSHLTKDNIPCGAISYKKYPVKLNYSLY